MIIYYDKATGKIIGTLDGRVHDEVQLNMSMGDKNQIDRLIVQWVPYRWYNKAGKEVLASDPTMYTADYRPDHPQGDLFREFDKNPTGAYQYRVDPATHMLVK